MLCVIYELDASYSQIERARRTMGKGIEHATEPTRPQGSESPRTEPTGIRKPSPGELDASSALEPTGQVSSSPRTESERHTVQRLDPMPLKLDVPPCAFLRHILGAVVRNIPLVAHWFDPGASIALEP